MILLSTLLTLLAVLLHALEYLKTLANSFILGNYVWAPLCKYLGLGEACGGVTFINKICLYRPVDEHGEQYLPSESLMSRNNGEMMEPWKSRRKEGRKSGGGDVSDEPNPGASYSQKEDQSMIEKEFDNFRTGGSSEIVQNTKSWLGTGNEDVNTVWE
ncbi:hypothetical protein WISP_56044 [Willisornis vidua]|uniref:Uncharacterized protein n=1 Tax=Willisornis vidua TaxID=1566151 RepID=A0ABQ9DBZ1_9PASS|nr:hypothetical protein WISP_56044 [Willisornis vidua]